MRIRWSNAWKLAAALCAAGVIWWARTWLCQAAGQLFGGMLLAMAALPVMKTLETRIGAGAAAAIALGGLAALITAVLVLLVPPLIRQGRELGAMLPGMYDQLEALLIRGESVLAKMGVGWNGMIRESLLHRGQDLLAAAISAAAGGVGGMVSSVGKGLLVPVFAFYFLRDRKLIARWLLQLLPPSARSLAVRMIREMRRETAGYLRGQLMACMAVGVLSAVGLLCCGVPAWLFLGFLMGLLEFVPYVGPFLGGGMAVMFALPGGTARTLWTLGTVVGVQQLEGMVLSPRLMSAATRLHPLAVVLCTVIGGAAAGFSGVLLAVPLLLCARAVLRVVSLRRFDQ